MFNRPCDSSVVIVSKLYPLVILKVATLESKTKAIVPGNYDTLYHWCHISYIFIFYIFIYDLWQGVTNFSLNPCSNITEPEFN